MKKIWITLLLGLWNLIAGIFGLSIANQSHTINTLSVIAIIIGLSLIYWTIILRIGLIIPKIYRFTHLYKQADIFHSTTQIVKKLNKKDITHLKKQQENKTIKQIFQCSPVLVDGQSVLKIDGWRHTQVTGWIYASDPDEALRTLHYHQFDENNEDNTPDFFK